MDIHLPKKDGKTATLEIKEEYDIPIIAVTADENIDNFFKIFDGCFIKPFSVECLITRIEELCS